ncbi:MAG: M67 family peptidase [Synechococcaceae bacterium WB9_4xC_028]|jgi:proteasome lid subunit RPN8/RPN11|nr:M67 family peptidase [Synechococcaceae bacterium WB9_4xC_028]
MWFERIGQLTEWPERVCLGWDCLIVLRSSLRAALPNEGCALLLGTAHAANPRTWWVQQIWPCCNVWRPGLEALPELPEAVPTRRNRFALDPREQLHAQRWARDRGLQVLGTAHSHPGGQPRPSDQDQRWMVQPGLMLIMGKDAQVEAWWIAAGTATRLPLVHTHGNDG